MAAWQTPQKKNEQVGQPTRSDLFFDNWRTRNLSVLMSVVGILAILGVGLIGLYLIFSMIDYSTTPIIGSYLAALDASGFLSLAIVLLATCVPLAGLNFWLRRYMPWRYEIERDFVEALKTAGILPTDIKKSCFTYRITISRFQQRAEICFKIKLPNREFKDIQGMGKGLRSSFDGVTYFAFDEPRGRAARRFNCCLVLKFGDTYE